MSDYGSTPPPPPPPGSGGGYSAPPPGDGGGGYGAPPPYGGGMGGQIAHPRGTTVLVLGILGILCLAPLGIVAWVMGNGAIREIDANPGRYSNRQVVQIGRILGIIATILLVLGIIFFIITFALAGTSSTSP